MTYGYARVSTDDQNPALQLAALQKAGCTSVFKDEGLSGATTKRPALTRCLKTLRPGDTLIVWKLDRLGRGLRDLIAPDQMTVVFPQVPCCMTRLSRAESMCGLHSTSLLRMR